MSEKGREYTVVLPENTYKRIVREIQREKIITPYMLAEKYNMTISLAKKVLRRMEEEGYVKLHSRNRRVAVYIPTGKR